ncbi:hypothetical protein OY671_010313, partial [Metschnikowia pulcherrima]
FTHDSANSRVLQHGLQSVCGVAQVQRDIGQARFDGCQDGDDGVRAAGGRDAQASTRAQSCGQPGVMPLRDMLSQNSVSPAHPQPFQRDGLRSAFGRLAECLADVAKRQGRCGMCGGWHAWQMLGVAHVIAPASEPPG